jgi:hypothetical protein
VVLHGRLCTLPQHRLGRSQRHASISESRAAIGISTLAGAAFFLTAVTARAQSSDPDQKQITVKPSDIDHQAAKQATVVYRKTWTGSRPKEVGESKLTFHAGTAPHSKSSSRDDGDNPPRYPGDLSYYVGAVVEFAKSHAIYMLPNGTCPITVCWGNPEGFVRDLGKSEFIPVTDQYVGLESDNRYRVGQRAFVPYTPPAVPFTNNDILAVTHAVASVTGENGYGHIYHVFLPPGQEECFDSTFTVCASNVFCAYHSSADFTDIGHILYSVEPYQNVIGCQVRPGTPNGTLVDSTNDTLSHELIETITDPDGLGWWNSTGLGMFGQEIADECIFLVRPLYSDPAIIKVRGNLNALQPEYNNRQHACTADN